MSRLKLAIPGALLAAYMLPALSQTPPDAGQILRETRRPDPVSKPVTPTLTIPADSDLVADASQRFPVSSIRIEGTQNIPVADLQPLVAAAIGSSVSLGELRQAASRITAYYRERGYVVARAYVPAQDINGGVVVIRVLEGTLQSSSISNRSIVTSRRLDGVLTSQGLNGRVIETGPTDRTLLLLADLPAVGKVSGNLRPGDRVGTSDLIVNVEPGEGVEGDVSVDSYGNRYTGRERFNGRIDFNSPFSTGDRLGLQGSITTEQLMYGRAAYDVPIGGDGLRVGLALSSSVYELGEEFAGLDAVGQADTGGIYGSYPLVRGLNGNVWLASNVEYRNLKDEIRALDTRTDKHATVGALEAFGDLTDSFAGGGYNTWRLAGSLGNLSIETPTAAAFDAIGPRTEGSYRKLQASLGRMQNVTERVLLVLNASGQIASDNLDSSEKFVLGGPYGVRAYPQGEGAGDEGWLATAEFRLRLARSLQMIAFYDYGEVDFNQSVYNLDRNDQTLAGYGVGLNAAVGSFSGRASAAWREKDAPVTAPDRKSMLWVQAGWGF